MVHFQRKHCQTFFFWLLEDGTVVVDTKRCFLRPEVHFNQVHKIAIRKWKRKCQSATALMKSAIF